MKAILPIYLAVAAVAFAAHWFAFQHLALEFRPALYALHGFALVAALLIDGFLARQSNARSFVVNYMGITGGKMFLSLFVLLIYAYRHRDYMLPFALSLVSLYFLYTALEIIRLLRLLKK